MEEKTLEEAQKYGKQQKEGYKEKEKKKKKKLK